MSQNSRDPLIGTRLGNYLLQSLIGRGGMARVYRSLDEKLDRPAAVKVLEVHPDDVDEVMIKRFKLEARAIAKFEHPSIVSVYQFDEDETRHLFYIAMKLIEGETLTQVLRQCNAESKLLSPERIVQIAWDVCSALDYAHQRGIVHRDVKPSNIMFDPTGRAILTDFGLALEEGGGTTLGTAFGTPRYISPEQAVSSQKAVAQSDIYSMGVVVYEMVTGRVPFHDESPMSIALYHITNPPPRPRSLNPDIPIPVEEAILRALEKTPEDRYPSAGAFAEALQAAYASAGYDIRLPSAPHTLMTAPAPLVIPADKVAAPAAEAGNAAQQAGRKGEKKPRRGTPPPATPDIHAEATPPGVQPVPQARTKQPARRINPLLIAVPLLIVVGVALIVLAQSGGLPTLGGGGTQAQTGSGGGRSLIEADAGMTFDLTYDNSGFVLRNTNARPLSVNGLIFRRGDGANALSFEAARFIGPIPPGQCAWIRRLSDLNAARPAGCPDPLFHVTTLPDDAARFWTGEDGQDSFKAVAENREIGSCPLDQGTCVFAVPEE